MNTNDKKRHMMDLEKYFLSLDELVKKRNIEVKVIAAKRREVEKQLKEAGGISLIINGITGVSHVEDYKHLCRTLCGLKQHDWSHIIYRIGVEPTCKNCLRKLRIVGRNSVPNKMRRVIEITTIK